MLFCVTSYNVLADAYIRPERYPGVPASVLAPERRRAALVRRIEALAGDVICLQEVEPDTLQALGARLGPRGYEAHYARKGGDRPDGCATFFKRRTFALQEVQTLYYRDGQGADPDSGHVALTLLLERAGRNVAVANTHLKWDPPGTPVADQQGYRQVAELLGQREAGKASCPAWILCGDFNVTPESDVVRMLLQQGLDYAHRKRAPVGTCIANRRARMIDYLFYTRALQARPLALSPLDDETPLPSSAEPSDHLAVRAWFRF